MTIVAPHAIIVMKWAICHVNVPPKRLQNALIAMKKAICPVNVHRKNSLAVEIVEIALPHAIIAMKLVTCHANVPPKRPQNVSNAVKRVTCHVNAQTAHPMKRFALVAVNQDTVFVIAQPARKIRLA